MPDVIVEPSTGCGSCWCCRSINELREIIARIDDRMAPVYARQIEESNRTRDSQVRTGYAQVARRLMDDWQRQREPFFKEIVRLTMMSSCMVPRIVVTPSFIAFRPTTKSDNLADAPSAFDPHDHGDEDDVHISNFIRGDFAPSLLDKKTLRHWASIGFRGARTGGVVIYYPARRLPPMENHDDGDAEPRLERKLWHDDDI